MNLLGKVSVLVAAIAVAVGAYLSYILSPTYLPWHEGANWQRFFKIYDTITKEMYKDCESFNITTTFGSTFGYSCGDAQNQPVFMFHGAGSNTIIYGDWLMPPIVHKYRAIAVDFPCDCGRSRPPDGDPSKCPQTEDEIAQWAHEVITSLHHSTLPSNDENDNNSNNNRKKVAVLGYSYGAYVAVLVAEKYPETIDKVLAIAPAGVFAPVEGGWIIRALVYGLTGRTMPVYNWFLRYMSTDPNFDVRSSQSAEHYEMTNAVRLLGATVLAVSPDQFSMDRLQAIISSNDKAQHHILLIGQNETVTNSTRAIEHAQQCGWDTRQYPNAGHLMLMEQPSRNMVAQDVAAILLATADFSTTNNNSEIQNFEQHQEQQQQPAEKVDGESASEHVTKDGEDDNEEEGGDTVANTSQKDTGDVAEDAAVKNAIADE